MFAKLDIMIIKTKVMIFTFPVKWGVMFLKNDIMFSRLNVMIFLLFRILFYLLTRLELFGCGAVLQIYEKAYYKNGTARVYHHNRRQADANAQLEPYGAVITHWHLTKMLDFQIVMIRFNYIMQLLVCVKNVRK